MNMITQKAKNRERILRAAEKDGVAEAARKYGVSRQSIYRWKKRYDGNWSSLVERSHRPHSHPRQHTQKEENQIKNSFKKAYKRYGWDGVYADMKRKGYTRSYSGMIYAGKRLGLLEKPKPKKRKKTARRYPDTLVPGEKVQIDVKEVPYNCLTGKAVEDERHFYQWTAIDECTRYRFIYAFEEHTPENSVKFFKKLEKVFPFKIQKVQTDNGTEFTYKFISDETPCQFDVLLEKRNIEHILIPPRTPWHNGKVERSHRNDQRYFYDWEQFNDLDDLNKKLERYLEWSNNKPMRALENKSPLQFLIEKTDSPS